MLSAAIRSLVARMWPRRGPSGPPERPPSLPFVLSHTCNKGAEIKRSGVSVVDRGEPVASRSEWHADGTAGKCHVRSHIAAVAPARVMGKVRPW